MIVYKVKNLQVVQVECEALKWPARDTDGDTIYINTHFTTKDEAYNCAIKDCDAGINMEASSIEQIQKDILRRQEAMTEYAIAKNHLRQERRVEEVSQI